MQFATEFAARVIDFYESYFDMKFPLPKCDLIAMPNLPCTAMENWGILMFRPEKIFYDSKEAGKFNDMQQVCLTVAHEICHSWFGNLVTINWWDIVWINEGFVTFLEYLCVDYLYPSFRNSFVN